MSESFWVDPEYAAGLARQGLGDLAGVFAWAEGDRLDKPTLEGWRQRWRVPYDHPRTSSLGPPRTSSLGSTGESGERVLYLKRFDRPRLRRQAERWLAGHWRRSTAGVEFDNARQLAAAGIAAAGPVAFGERMLGPWERRSFVLLREVAGQSLERWVPVHLPPSGEVHADGLRRRLVDRLARFVAAFHGAGFVHRDLYLSHVFLDLGADGQPGESASGPFALIDLQRVFRPRWRGRRWVVKDLAALDFSTPADRVGQRDRLRFLCRYVRECGRFGSARELARQVGARAARMRRKQAVRAAAERVRV